MKRSVWIAFGLMLVLLTATMARAENDKDKDKEAKEHAAARQALGKAKITLREAIEIALKKVPNAKAVEAEIELEGDGVEYEVELIAEGKHWEVEIDGITGNVKESEEEKAEDSEEEKTEESAAKAPISLLQALEAAAKKVPNSNAFEAEAEMEDGKLIFEVEVVAGDKVMEVEIDANTGMVLDVEEE